MELNKKNIIVTGSSSGLGLFLKKKLNAYGYESNGNNKAVPLSNNNVIIHTIQYMLHEMGLRIYAHFVSEENE